MLSGELDPCVPLTDSDLVETDGTPKGDDEHYRLGGRQPLKTLAILSVGPLVSQFVSALYGIVTSMWMARALGDVGIAAVSVFSIIDTLGRSFGFFMNCAATSKISGLFGENRGSEAGQVVCDLFRFCFVCGVLVPVIFIPCARPLANWFGTSPEVLDYAFLYLAPLLGCCSVTCVFLMFCGCLQAEGRSILVGAIQICSFTSNMLLFNPVFLLVFKWKTVGAAMATVTAELIPAVVLAVLFFRGKFAVKPDVRGLLRKFSPHTTAALTIGVSQLALDISRCIPCIFLRKFMGLCAEHNPDATFDDALAGFNAVIRIWALTDAVRVAISTGLLPAASYAFTSHQVGRLLALVGHACWLDLIWGIFSCICTSFGGKYLAMTMSSSPTYLKWAVPMMREHNWEAPFCWMRNVIQTTLQALQYGKLAAIFSFTTTLTGMVGALGLLYSLDNTNFVKLMWCYPIGAGLSVGVGLIVLIYPMRKLYISRNHYPQEIKDPELHDQDVA
jgi:Na+-driven multidrug efflux pump